MPVNVNYYYSPGEVADLLAYLAPRAVIYHRSLGARFASVLRDAARSGDLLISVDDGGEAPSWRVRSHWTTHWPRVIPIAWVRCLRTTC